MVHLCAPTTYAKQDNQLCDSKIYNFKHESYHRVKCISKELGYRNNRGTRRRWFIPKFTLLRVLISVGAVLGTKIPKCHEGLTECSSSLPTKMEDSIHYGTLRVVTEPAQSLGQSPQFNWRLPRTPQSPQSLRNLHNLIGGSQEIATKASQPSKVPRTQE